MSDFLRDQTDVPFVMVPNAVVDDETSFDDAAEKLVYIVLKRHANLRGENAFPSMATIAKKVPCSESTVKRKIKSLVSKKLITKENRVHVETGAKTSNMYTIEDFGRWVTENHGSQRTMGTVTENHGVGSQGPMPGVTETDKEYPFKNNSFKNNSLSSSSKDSEVNNETTEVGKTDHGNGPTDKQHSETIELYMKCGWGFPSPIVREAITHDLNDYGFEIVCYAMRTAALRNAGSYKYTEPMFRKWEQHNLTTVEAVKQFEDAESDKRVAQGQRKQGNGGYSNGSTQANQHRGGSKTKQVAGSNLLDF